jgi:probable HAF family extracellular repeat protein
MRDTPFSPRGFNHLMLVAVATLWACATPAQAQVEIRITDLGTLGGLSSQAVAINSSGQVVGSSQTADGNMHAFSWTAAHGMIDLGTLGGPNSEAVAINNTGQVIGTADTSDDVTRAFLWTATAGMIDLGTLGGLNSHAVALNDAGQIVGNSETPNGRLHAFSWTPTGGMIDLGTFGGHDFSSAVGVNNGGQVAGTASVPDLQANQGAFLWTASDGPISLGSLGFRGSFAVAVNEAGHVAGSSIILNTYAFLWTATSGMTNLGTLGEAYSVATALNSADQVVGYSLASSFTDHAFIWTRATGIIDLGTLGGGRSVARAVNDAGQVVGSSLTTDRVHEHAFSWTADGGMIDLGTLGGASSFAEAINGAGHIVGSSATVDGDEHAALWDTRSPIDTTAPVVIVVPPPSTVDTLDPHGAVVLFAATASDPDDDTGPVTCTPRSGSLFPIGTTTVTCTATDAHGNTGTTSFQVNVTYTPPLTWPEITGVSVRPAVLWPPDNRLVNVTVSYTASDSSAHVPTCALVATSNDPTSDASDIAIIDAHHLRLRASKAKRGAERIYSIRVTCQNASGITEAQTTVTVPHSRSHSDPHHDRNTPSGPRPFRSALLPHTDGALRSELVP